MTDESVSISGPVDAALRTCAQTMARAGFSDIATDSAAGMVQGRKRQGGQWTKATLAVFLVADGDRVRLEMTSGARPQSITGLVSDPGKRMVADFLQCLPSS